MRRRLLLLLTLLGVVAGAAACDDGGSSTGPPSIKYGRDTCADCHMIIEDPRFAAAYRTAGGETRLFDDPADLFRYGIRTGELDAAQAWVHDYDTEEWVEADKAWYVRSPEVDSPMAGGLAAFATRQGAEAYAPDVSGHVIQWNDVLGLARDGELNEPAHDPGEHSAVDQAGNQGGDQ